MIERDEKLEVEIEAITGAIIRKERQVKKIENILGTLTEEEGMLIEMKYFKRYTVGRNYELGVIHKQYQEIINSINNMYIKTGIVIAFIGVYLGIVLDKVCALQEILDMKTLREGIGIGICTLGLLVSAGFSIISILKLVEVLKSYTITTLDEESLSVENTLEQDEYLATIGLVEKYRGYLSEIENVSNTKK